MPIADKIPRITTTNNNSIKENPFTDGMISKYSTPTITTVTQNGIEMGNIAAKILIERLEDEHEEDEDDEEEETYKTTVIETHLIERESTN